MTPAEVRAAERFAEQQREALAKLFPPPPAKKDAKP